MRNPNLTRAAALLLLLSVAAVAEKARKPVPPLPAAQYPMHQTVAGVTIAAEPGDTRETRPDTRLDYYTHNMLPVRVIVTNDTDNTIKLDEARIHLVANDNTVLKAATPDDLERRLFRTSQIKGTKIPLIPITIHPKPVDQKIQLDDDDFGFKTTTVAPHSTLAGYVYYDYENMGTAMLLEHGILELRKVRFADGDYLDAFEIGLRPASTELKSEKK